MARRSTPPPPKLPLALARPRAEAERLLGQQIERGKLIQGKQPSHPNTVSEYSIELNKWIDYNGTVLKRCFTDESLYWEYDQSTTGSYVDESRPEVLILMAHVAASIARQIAFLESVIDRLELFDEPIMQLPSMVTVSSSLARPRDLTKVFVVHGRDTAPRDAVARVLGQFGITPIILTEQANRGGTVIEKVEANNGVGFAVVLLTPDDEGYLKGEKPQPRPRQNVMLELGYFIGLLGRRYVCAFNCGGVEIPSDFAGVIAEEFDTAGGWRMRLAIELKAAGFHIDLNKLLPS
jgi:predicted nucleotide-binding protein